MYNNDSGKEKKTPCWCSRLSQRAFVLWQAIEKPKIKCLNNINLLSGLPFYEELLVIKSNYAFRGYAMSHKVKLIEKKIQLNS